MTDKKQVYPSAEDPQTHSTWGHFQGYALRVRSISLDPCCTREGSVWNNLVPLVQGNPVLPALRRATLIHESSLSREDIASMLRVTSNPRRGPLWLIGPSVHQLSVSINERTLDVPMAAVQEIVRVACRMAPTLEELRIFAPWSIDLEFLRCNEYLRAVKISTSTGMGALRTLTSLPCLEHLSLSVLTAIPSHLAFQHVRVLALESTWPHLTSLLDQIDLPQLRSLSAIVKQWLLSGLVPLCTDCFRTLSKKHTHLTTLHVKCSRPIDPFPIIPFHPVRVPSFTGGTLGTMIEPLLPLRELRDVSLDFKDFLFPYSSSDIQSFAESLVMAGARELPGGRCGQRLQHDGSGQRRTAGRQMSRDIHKSCRDIGGACLVTDRVRHSGRGD